MTATPELRSVERRFPVGAEYTARQGTHFRVWAPKHSRVSLAIESDAGLPASTIPLIPEPDGYFSALVESVVPGTRYRFLLGDDPAALPDPASRFQPSGPHGASAVVDSSFAWTDDHWRGVRLDGQVLYELHIGTFTEDGTWSAALGRLAALVELGVTTIEMMPIAEFGGRRGWGYDGVDIYAPSHLYGAPDDLRRFIDGAHQLGLGVILDVVYNHVGPDGNYLARFSPDYFSTHYDNEWGEALNFDQHAGSVREFFVANAVYWIEEFHFDGLRFDATQQVFDASREHILAEMSRRVRAAAGRRSLLLVAENEPQDVRALRSHEQDGFNFDALWNDDFHHAALVAVTGFRQAYYTDYRGTPGEFVAMAKWGFLFQGQRYAWQGKPRGTPTQGFEGARFITFLENHDQVANAPNGQGDRLHAVASPGMLRTLTAAWLLSPGTPMLFQGQERAALAPFMFFSDHQHELATAVRVGRAAFMRQFFATDVKELHEALPDPNDASTFARCKLCDADEPRQVQALALHRDLLRLRRDECAIRDARRATLDAAVLTEHAFVLRYFSSDPRSFRAGDSSADDRLVVVNFGSDCLFDPASEPLLAPPSGMRWSVIWSSESAEYGGVGVRVFDPDEGWRLQALSAILLAPLAR